MIQRIQSIYLLCVMVISIALVQMDFTFFSTTNADKTQTVSVDFNSTDTANEVVGSNDGLIYLLYASVLVSIVCIFLFRNRKLQMRMIMGLMVIGIVLLVNMYTYSVGKHYFENGSNDFTAFAITPLAIILFGFLALRGVQRDDKLVKSVDRIR